MKSVVICLLSVAVSLSDLHAQTALPADFPPIRTEVLGQTAPGFVFVTVSRILDDVGFYIMMLNDDGTPFFHRDLVTDYSYDFKMQPDGSPSYAQFLSHFRFTGGGEALHTILGRDLEIDDSWQMGNGYTAEAHDFQLLPNGHALMFSYHLEPMDLRPLGGHPRAMVAASIIQEQDADRNVVFEWRSSDHYEITDSRILSRTRSSFDPVHINSIILDDDGHLLVTPNGMSEVTKISRQTGEILWRLGGMKNDFAFSGLEPSEFANGLHNVSRLANGNILFFDNTRRGSDLSSRAVEYHLDEENKVATLVWQYIPDEPVLGVFRGSAQRLPNGNTFIGWGNASDAGGPVATEVTPEGEEVFRLYFDIEGLSSYRAFRYPFPPTAAAEATERELIAGNVYEFSQGEVAAQLRVDDVVGEGDPEVTLTRHDYAPSDPEFQGKAPLVRPVRFVLEQAGIQQIVGALRFDAAALAIPAAGEAVVYHRDEEGRGLFLPLPTTYDAESGRVVAELSGAGEFIIARPDHPSLALPPHLVEPPDGGGVNHTRPVRLRWSPRGYVRDYALQVSRDAGFAELVIDASGQRESLYTLEEIEAGAEYHWRARVGNDAGESDWSPVHTFMAVPPELTLEVPSGGERWQRGEPHFVVWDANIEGSVAVELWRGDRRVTVLDTVASTAALSWEIDPELPLASDYKIRVLSLAGELTSESASAFSVIDDLTAVADAFAASSPSTFRLEQNYPNPLNPNTTIVYQLKERGTVQLVVHSITGQVVRTLIDDVQEPGVHQVGWSGRDQSGQPVASGVYLYRLRAGSQVATRRMLVLR